MVYYGGMPLGGAEFERWALKLGGSYIFCGLVTFFTCFCGLVIFSVGWLL